LDNQQRMDSMRKNPDVAASNEEDSNQEKMV
jgi:hypothetical protein